MMKWSSTLKCPFLPINVCINENQRPDNIGDKVNCHEKEANL